MPRRSKWGNKKMGGRVGGWRLAALVENLEPRSGCAWYGSISAVLFAGENSSDACDEHHGGDSSYKPCPKQAVQLPLAKPMTMYRMLLWFVHTHIYSVLNVPSNPTQILNT